MPRATKRAAVDPITPEARAVGSPEGSPVVLADGRTWTLAACQPTAGGVWDTLYDDNVIRHRYQPADVQTAALRLLRANYRVTEAEAFALIRDVDPADLVAAVERALFGPTGKEIHRTWTDWVEASLWASGIDPATVPPDRLLTVLDVLVETGRTVPIEKFISSQQGAAKRQSIFAGLKN